MTTLHKLPTGDWITLSMVTAIVTHRERMEGATVLPPEVVVVWGDSYYQLQFADHDSAQIYADELAALVNRSGAG